METVIIGIGSNLGDKLAAIQSAGNFLERLSHQPVQKGSVWESEPVGGARFPFYNTAAKITTDLQPEKLLIKLKAFEQECGREKNPVRWGPRVLDLDIIGFGDLVMDNDTLIIPHPEYKNRLFVLHPLKEVAPEWRDPHNGKPIADIIASAPHIEIKKTGLNW
jgi:2-amino-4-hydroxy-6-hydroxymethyldihydropteridine diphosphokinase